MRSVTWFRAAAVRALKTAAQAAIGVFGASALLTEVDFGVVGSAAGFAAALSLLTSIAGIPEVNEGESPVVTLGSPSNPQPG